MTRASLDGNNLPQLLRALDELEPVGATSRAQELGVADALSKRLPPHLRRLASEIWSLRLRARGKLERADELVLFGNALQQATDHRVARWRAERFARFGSCVVDATAGVGGDAMQAVGCGLRVVAAEPNPDRAAALAHNLGVFGADHLVVRARAEALPVARPELLAIDPDRRPGERRSLDPRRAEPSWACVLGLVERTRAVASVKLAPGFDVGALGEHERPALPHRWSWVSLAGELKELALWCGPALEGSARREAITIGADGRVHERTGDPSALPDPGTAREDATYLFEADRALVRSGLVAALADEHSLHGLMRDGGYLAGAAPVDSPWLTRFRVLESSPMDGKRIRALLREHDIGRLTVKKRGIPDSAEELARRWKGKGTRPGTLIALGHLGGQRVWLVERDLA